ncbi:DUF4224 domain-containing protein [Marinobacter salarius]|uniref:DUF4224 domain-containing protein n=1 Tax=Marinobacter salarius TaxID=1420917 RepID=UPI003D1374BC
MMFLTADEVKTLTGKARKSAQMQWLDAQKIRYFENGIGEIIISRSHVEHLLGGEHDYKESTGPDFSALRKVS